MASRQHVTSLGLGTPGGLLATFGLGHIAPFVPKLPAKARVLDGANPAIREVGGANPAQRTLDGANPVQRTLSGPNPAQRTLDGADPSLRTLDGQTEDC